MPQAGKNGRKLATMPRPAHMHFTIGADGYKPLTTELYFAGDPYLDSDCRNDVKDSLVIDLTKTDADGAPYRGVRVPGWYQPNRPASRRRRRPGSASVREARRKGGGTSPVRPEHPVMHGAWTSRG